MLQPDIAKSQVPKYCIVCVYIHIVCMYSILYTIQKQVDTVQTRTVGG